MASVKAYLLRDIPAGLWTRVAAKARRDELSLRGLILRLLQGYADETVTLTEPRAVGKA
jgi:hypothetical protein